MKEALILIEQIADKVAYDRSTHKTVFDILRESTFANVFQLTSTLCLLL